MPGVITPSVAEGPRNGDLPAYVSNGLIGLRVREVPLIAGMVLVSGLAGEHPERQIEAAAAAPYPLAGDLALNGDWLSDQPWTISGLRQSYDFGSGELSSQFRFTAAERTLSVEVLTFASRTAPAVVAQEVRLTADTACDLTFRALVDVDGGAWADASATYGHARRARARVRRQPVVGDRGGLGRCGVALLTEGPDGAQRQVMAHPPEKERDSGAPVKPLKALIEGVAREYVHRSMMQIDVSSPEPQLCLRCAGSGIVDTGVCHMCDRSGKAQIDTDLSAAAEQDSAPRSQPNSSARLATQR